MALNTIRQSHQPEPNILFYLSHCMDPCILVIKWSSRPVIVFSWVVIGVHASSLLFWLFVDGKRLNMSTIQANFSYGFSNLSFEWEKHTHTRAHKLKQAGRQAHIVCKYTLAHLYDERWVQWKKPIIYKFIERTSSLFFSCSFTRKWRLLLVKLLHFL